MSEIAELFRSDSYSHRVAAEVRAHAGRRQIKQKDIARVLGIDPSQVSGRMRGRIAFTLDELATLAELFEVQPAELMPQTRTAGASAGEAPTGAEVGHQGLEPRTRWFGVTPGTGDESTTGALADVIPLTPDRTRRTDEIGTPKRGETPHRIGPNPVHCVVSA